MIDLLADENVDGHVVQWLRRRGHDVAWISEDAPGIEDVEVLRTSRLAARVLLTFDLDFGELVVRQRLATRGVVIIRLRPSSALSLVEHLERAWPVIESNAIGNLIVVTHNRIRIRPLSN